MLALARFDSNTAHVLLTVKQDVNAVDSVGDTALDYGQYPVGLKVVDELYERGAHYGARKRWEVVRETNIHGRAPRQNAPIHAGTTQHR